MESRQTHENRLQSFHVTTGSGHDAEAAVHSSRFPPAVSWSRRVPPEEMRSQLNICPSSTITDEHCSKFVMPLRYKLWITHCDGLQMVTDDMQKMEDKFPGSSAEMFKPGNKEKNQESKETIQISAQTRSSLLLKMFHECWDLWPPVSLHSCPYTNVTLM